MAICDFSANVTTLNSDFVPPRLMPRSACKRDSRASMVVSGTLLYPSIICRQHICDDQ